MKADVYKHTGLERDMQQIGTQKFKENYAKYDHKRNSRRNVKEDSLCSSHLDFKEAGVQCSSLITIF